MATDRQIAANRRNAKKSTGPRTAHGKAVSSLNAVQHGLRARTPVLPGFEDESEWRAHRESVLAGLTPLGPLETILAERVALILWRLGRVARYEHEVTTIAQDHAFDDVNAQYDRSSPSHNTLESARQRLEQAGAHLRDLRRFAEMAPDHLITGTYVDLVLEAVAAQIDDFDLDTFSAPDIVPDGTVWADVPEWPVERLNRLLTAIAEANGLPPDQPLADAIAAAEDSVASARADMEPYNREIATLRRERILPRAPQLDQVIRYEAHLARQLEKTLAHLRALQAARPAPPPITPPAPPIARADLVESEDTAFSQTNPIPGPAPSE
jgi:hypothetical protein